MISTGRLAELELFRGLSAAALAALSAGSTERSYRVNDRLYARGDTPAGLTVIVSGRVKVVRETGNRRLLVHTEGDGGTLGDVPVFAGGTYPATAFALEPTHCIVFRYEALSAAIREDPGTALALLARLAERVRLLVERLDNVRNQRVDARLAAYLLARAGRTTRMRFSLGMTQTALAEELGTVREVLVRELGQLRRRRVIELTRAGVVHIHDRAALEEIVTPHADSSRKRSSTSRRTPPPLPPPTSASPR